jgi:flavin-dependent dehydrogenase
VIGAGPVGLAAAAHLLDRGLEPLILEAGPQVGTNIAPWRASAPATSTRSGTRPT